LVIFTSFPTRRYSDLICRSSRSRPRRFGARIGRLFGRKRRDEASGSGRRHRIRKLRLLLLLLIFLLLGFASFAFGMVTAIAEQIDRKSTRLNSSHRTI